MLHVARQTSSIYQVRTLRVRSSVAEVPAGKAFTQLKGGSCDGNNPEGLTVRVLDNNIMRWTRTGPNGQGTNGVLNDPTSQTAASTSHKATDPPAPVTSTSVAPPPTSTSSGTRPRVSTQMLEVPPSQSALSKSQTMASGPSRSEAVPRPTLSSSEGSFSGSGCTYGVWQCKGVELQICNYVTTTSLGEYYLGTILDTPVFPSRSVYAF